MKNIQKITSSVIIMMIICSLSFRVFAIESSSYYQNKQNEALQNSQATQSQLNGVEGEIDEVLQEVANLNSSI